MIDIKSLLQENKTVAYLNFGTVKYKIGTLLYANRSVYFEFSQDFLNHYLPISPLHLKPIAGIQEFSNPDHFNLPGVFYDALPDGWGLLLQDRYLRKTGISIAEISPIHRLLLRENRSVGALEFIPEYKFNESESFKPIDLLFSESENVLTGKSSDVIPLLLQLNGSSTGARSKAMMKYDSQKNEWYYGNTTNDAEVEDWLVKFPTKQDGLDAGAIEFVYAEMAKNAGLIIPETKLIESGHHQGYFAVKRFDHIKNRRFHTHSISGLLHHNFRIPSLDYEQIFQVVWSLTQSISELEQLFLQLVFNVVFHNRDDHGKNLLKMWE